jgi:hypothetical protein
MRVIQLAAALGLLLLASTAVHASSPPSGSAQLAKTAGCNGHDCDGDGFPLRLPATDAGEKLGRSWHLLQQHRPQLFRPCKSNAIGIFSASVVIMSLITALAAMMAHVPEQAPLLLQA